MAGFRALLQEEGRSADEAKADQQNLILTHSNHMIIIYNQQLLKKCIYIVIFLAGLFLVFENDFSILKVLSELQHIREDVVSQVV